jgi:hypothetical protein
MLRYFGHVDNIGSTMPTIRAEMNATFGYDIVTNALTLTVLIERLSKAG